MDMRLPLPAIGPLMFSGNGTAGNTRRHLTASLQGDVQRSEQGCAKLPTGSAGSQFLISHMLSKEVMTNRWPVRFNQSSGKSRAPTSDELVAT